MPHQTAAPAPIDPVSKLSREPLASLASPSPWTVSARQGANATSASRAYWRAAFRKELDDSRIFALLAPHRTDAAPQTGAPPALLAVFAEPAARAPTPAPAPKRLRLPPRIFNLLGRVGLDGPARLINLALSRVTRPF